MMGMMWIMWLMRRETIQRNLCVCLQMLKTFAAFFQVNDHYDW